MKTLDVGDFDAALRQHRDAGWRPVTIRPADDPAEVVLESPDGDRLMLRRTPLSISRADDDTAWHTGRAGMAYRDLIPDRWDGRYVASHIAVPAGGRLADDVHFHHVDFQFLAVRRGWVDVEYEGWGERLRMEVGDVVLQPPGIRHQVIEASPGFEIVEVGSPADHLTEFDPATTLPDRRSPADRTWGGQRFVFSTARDRTTDSWDHPGFIAADTGIGAATGGRVEVLMVDADPQRLAATRPARSLRFIFVMDGEVTVTLDDAAPIRLGPGDAITIPADSRELVSDPSADCRLLDVTTPAGVSLAA